jgi:predicted transcriptional regulator
MKELMELPYGADLNVAFAMTEIANRESSITTPDLFKQVNASNKPLKSYSKKMAEFLGLISTNGQNINITKLGQLFVANKTEQDKKKFLANNLPKKYITILGWIKNAKDMAMELNEIKQAIIQNEMESKPNSNIYDWMLNSFSNYGDYIGILKYIKGQKSRCEITSLGEQVLSSGEKEVSYKEEPTTSKNPKQLFYADVDIDGEYPIRILAKESKPFDWDIHNEEDWKVVEAALEAIKRRWKNKQNNHNPSGVSNNSNANSNSS